MLRIKLPAGAKCPDFSDTQPINCLRFILAYKVSAVVVERESLAEQATRASRRAIAVWAGTSTIALAIVGLIIGAPLAQAHGHPEFAAAIYKTFSFVCHQIPERSFQLSSHQFAVCSRCTGLYTGFAVAAMIYPLARSLKRTDTPSRLWLILAAVPLAIDFSLTYFEIWSNTHLSRFSTGALLSSVAVFYIMPGLIELSSAIARRFDRESAIETL